MDTMTQQNASLVEETASASEEMSNQAEELLDKFTSWYPDNEEVRKISEEYPSFKKELLKFAVSGSRKPLAPPRSLDRINALHIFSVESGK